MISESSNAAGDPDVRGWRLHDPTLPPEPDRTALARRLRRGSIPRALWHRARSRPTAARVGVDGEVVDFRRLCAEVQALAVSLAGEGVDSSRATLLAAPNSLDLIRCYLALLCLRSPVVMSNPASTAAEFETQIALTNPAMAITGGPADDTIAGSAAGADLLHRPLDHLRPTAGSLDVAALPRSNDVALWALTSGTTGTPKQVPLRHGDMEASMRGMMTAWRWRRGDIGVHALPMSHQHGLGALHAAILAGTSLYCLSRFDPERLIAEAKHRRASVIFAVPAMWERIAAAHGAVDAPHLRLLISGSAPLPETLFERIEGIFGLQPLERYGTTEAGLSISNLYEGPRRAGAVGYPVPGVETRIDASTGELSLRGPQVFAGYVGRPPLGPEDWFATGDIVERNDSTGEIRIVGRSKDIIITGGVNVAPREVENVLAHHPAVDSVAVVGVPSVRWGEEVTAFVTSQHDLDADDLRTWARERLSGYKVPKRFHRVEAFPRNSMGKILRYELSELGTALGDDPEGAATP